jgi:predicted dinucleotide-binding enzyme
LILVAADFRKLILSAGIGHVSATISRTLFSRPPIQRFEQYRDRLSKNTCDRTRHRELQSLQFQLRERENMRVGILGSGLMGGKLGTIFARAGHEVVFSYARSNEKLKKLAWEAQGPGHGNARAGTPSEAAQEADAILLAVHWSRIEDVLNQTGDLSGKVVLTCSLPMNEDNTELVVAQTSSGAEKLARMIPNARVVSAFNTVPSEVLFGVYEARRTTTRPSLAYSGDDKGSKAVAAELIRDVGFDPLDAGPLRVARYTEPFAMLVAELAYTGEDGPELAYTFKWFTN